MAEAASAKIVQFAAWVIFRLTLCRVQMQAGPDNASEEGKEAWNGE